MHPRHRRRDFLRAIGAASMLPAAAGLSGCGPFLSNSVRGLFQRGPAAVPPPGPRAFVQRCFDGVDRTRQWDNHVHVFGDGRSGSGMWFNPKYGEGYPEKLLIDIYQASAGVEDTPTAEEDAIARLVRLQRLANPHGKLVMLGFDYAHDEQGNKMLDKSSFHTPNSFVQGLFKKYPDVMRWGAGIHPYRVDAVDALEEAYEGGAVLVKWLPNTHFINPASDRCDAFYKKLAELKLPLVTHAGYEAAAEDIAGDQTLGNPLRLRRALDHGVTVVVAHCAGLGESQDLDADEKTEMASFDLWRRLMDERQYEQTLFADISAMCQFNRATRPLEEIIVDKALHPRLINGSDYPLPAVRWLIWPPLLVRRGFITDDEAAHCERIADVNPLLFDFCLKRSLKVERGGREHRFSDVVFESRRVFQHLPQG